MKAEKLPHFYRMSLAKAGTANLFQQFIDQSGDFIK